jgi:hypothetical protein
MNAFEVTLWSKTFSSNDSLSAKVAQVLQAAVGALGGGPVRALSCALLRSLVRRLPNAKTMQTRLRRLRNLDFGLGCDIKLHEYPHPGMVYPGVGFDFDRLC